MVLLQKKNLKSCDGLKQSSTLFLTTRSETILFDCPAILWGTSFRPPCFDSPQKDLKFIVPKLHNVEKIFVTSSESLGILFLDLDVDIYITQPVYEQILANYYSLLDLRITYTEGNKDSGYDLDIVGLDMVNLEQLKRNVRFITYNERIIMNDFVVDCRSSGIFVGWCTFSCKFSEKN